MKKLLIIMLLIISLSSCGSDKQSTSNQKQLIDTSQPIYTQEVSADYGAMVCPLDALFDQRVGHGAQALFDAKSSILNHQKKIAEAGCEELKGGIRVYLAADQLERINDLQAKGNAGFVSFGFLEDSDSGKVIYSGDLTNNPTGKYGESYIPATIKNESQNSQSSSNDTKTLQSRYFTLEQVTTECNLENQIGLLAIKYRLATNNLTTSEDVSRNVLQSIRPFIPEEYRTKINNNALEKRVKEIGDFGMAATSYQLAALVASGYQKEIDDCIRNYKDFKKEIDGKELYNYGDYELLILNPDGIREVILSNGDRYFGNFIDDKLSGNVTYSYKNGNKYIGEFKDGKENGRGTAIAANGIDKYVGDFKDGKMNGHGTLYYANGDKYVGEFRDGKMNGQGIFKQVNGNMYVGEIKDNLFNGHGTTSAVDGTKLTGEFKDGKFIGK